MTRKKSCKNDGRLLCFQFFVLDLVVGGTRLSDENIYSQLSRITKMAAERKTTASPVGILTSANRHFWAASREKLMQGLCILKKYFLRNTDKTTGESSIFGQINGVKL